MDLLTTAGSYINEVFTIFFPHKCPGCGRAGSELVCPDCERKIREISEPYCRRCGIPLPPGINAAADCGWCREQEIYFDAARSALNYQSPVREIVMRFKFHRSYGMGRYLRGRLARRATTGVDIFDIFGDVDFIVPVPLHPRRRIWRGFNQSQYLAEEAARIWDKRIENCLLRIKNTRPQSLLSPKERRKNVSGAFRLKGRADVKDKTVLLIDDVMTTGATVNECSRVLKEGGAARVVVLTLARGGAS